jgi:hypothetical protein
MRPCYIFDPELAVLLDSPVMIMTAALLAAKPVNERASGASHTGRYRTTTSSKRTTRATLAEHDP